MNFLNSNFESVSSCTFYICLCIPACVMNEEYTSEVVMNYFYQLSILDFDGNVFKAIFSIQRFLNLTKCREVIAKLSLLIAHAGTQNDMNWILVVATIF